MRKYAYKEYLAFKMEKQMNSAIFFEKKVLVNFYYIKTGDISRSKECDRLKVFIKGGVKEITYIGSLNRYRAKLEILFFDLKDKKTKEETLVTYTLKPHEIKFKIVGVYRSIY